MRSHVTEHLAYLTIFIHLLTFVSSTFLTEVTFLPLAVALCNFHIIIVYYDGGQVLRLVMTRSTVDAFAALETPLLTAPASDPVV